MYPALCAEVDAPYGQPGAMVLAFTEEERANIQTLYEQGAVSYTHLSSQSGSPGWHSVAPSSIKA